MVTMKDLQTEMSDLRANNELLHESLAQMAAKYEGVEWQLLEGYSDSGGLTLEALKEFQDKLSDMIATNPLLKRAAQLRHGYVFGKGMVLKEVKPAAQSIIDEPLNERALFSVQAYEELVKEMMSAGNLFVLYNKRTKQFTRVPLKEIAALETDPESTERIQYIKRTWNSVSGKNTTQHEMWYPVSTYKRPPGARNKIEDVPVSSDAIMYHETSNRQVGWTLGVPDALAAMSWAIAYSHYLNNNATLVKAYSQFAWKVTAQTKRGVDNAAARVSVPGVGGTAVQAAGNELSPVNATGSQVNFNNGQPLAAMVASSLGISVIALLSSPGAAGGSYGAAATLDAPTIIGMVAIQDTWARFYRNLLRDLKSKDVSVEFPAIDTDPTYRQIVSLTQAYVSGALHRKEYRAAVLDILDIAEPLEGLPQPDAFNQGGQPSSGNPVSSQGNSGAVQGGTGQGDTDNSGRTDTISGNK